MSLRSLFPWMGVALGVHGVAFAASDRHPYVAPAAYAPLEVDLVSPPEPEPEPPAPPPEEPAEEPAPAPVQAKAAPREAPPAPPRAEAARAGALLTAGDATDANDPVSFVTDPNGTSYGHGVVARGGTLDHGTGAKVAPVVSVVLPTAPRPFGDEITPAANLRRAPALEEADACRGFFPAGASVDMGSVDLHVVVQPTGRVLRVSVARESPEGQGFGAAARTCLASKSFSPGLGRDGSAVTSVAAVRVRFARH